MKRLALLMLVVLLAWDFSGGENTAQAGKEIESLLDLQKAAWNRGDLDTFMKYYWNSEDLTFQSGAQRLQGWKALLARYQKNYGGGNGDMGSLDFTDLVIRVLSGEHAYVLGRWKVIQKGLARAGVFTLILKRTPEGWRIIHDHTS